MRYFLSVILVLFIFSISANAQDKVLSKADQFSSKSGTIIQKEFIDIGKIRSLDIKVLKIKDLNSGTNIACLRLEYTSSGQYSMDTHIASLDTDEIDGLIKTITNIQTNVLNKAATYYTEYIYRSRTGMEFGAYCNQSESKWMPFIKIDKYSNKSLYPIRVEEISTLLDLIKKAQEYLK